MGALFMLGSKGSGPPHHAQSLQARITAAILLTAVAVLMVGCTLFMLEQHRSEAMRDRDAGRRTASLLAEAQAPAVAALDRAWTQDRLGLVKAFKTISYAEVRDLQGRSLAVFHRPGVSSRDREESLPFTAPILWRGRPVGALAIAVQPTPAATLVGRFLALGAALFFAATGLALFLGRWLAARITTPLARLALTMEEVGRTGGFQVRVEPGADDEVGRLTERFNELMAALHVKDVALRRTLTELVDARDAAEAANLAKSQFLANMSHEIRTPLNGVLAMAQVLEQDGLQPAQRGQVQVIRRSGETLLSLLNDVLDVSKIEAGKLELEVADFDAVDVAEATVAGFTAVAAAKSLTLVLDVAPEATGVRRGDAARLRQILNNFLSNALKFTEAGEVRLTVAGEGPGGADGLRLTVSDTGMGIPAEKMSLLFQKFSQVDASTTRRFGGTGLGLAICREISALMGGRVLVESETGKGSAFIAVLPLARVAEVAARSVAIEGAEETETGLSSSAAAPSEPAAGHARIGDDTVQDLAPAEPEAVGALRVLAAEDNATNQLVLRTIMQIFGCDLTLVSDGAEAVETWRGGQFDVVLMDIQMPCMDGVAATRAIRTEEARTGRPRTPILALSANALTHQVEEYLHAGMDGHIAKPIELAKLQAALEQVFADAGDARETEAA